MISRIETLHEKKLVGKHVSMSLSDNRTVELWKSFMPERNNISNRVSDELFSLQVYHSSHDFTKFNPDAVFQKWALAEVSAVNSIPDTMEAFTLNAGLYAVFLHKGPASDGYKTFQYIFGVWLPQSEYVIDDRPHFEVLGSKYKNNEVDSEEEIWVPVKKK